MCLLDMFWDPLKCHIVYYDYLILQFMYFLCGSLCPFLMIIKNMIVENFVLLNIFENQKKNTADNYCYINIYLNKKEVLYFF